MGCLSITSTTRSPILLSDLDPLEIHEKNPKLAIKAAIEFATDRLRYAIPDTGHATQDTRYAIREIEEKEPGDRTPDKRAKANTSKGSV